MARNLAVGFRFRPTDEELIGYYLRKKNMGISMPEEVAGHIVERPLFGDNNSSGSPWNVIKEDDPVWEDIDDGKKSVAYVFCKQLYMADTKNRCVRMAGCGTWKGKAEPKTIKIPKRFDSEYFGGVSVPHDGQKCSFTFTAKKGKEREMEGRGKWIMHEYSLKGKKDEYVICKIMRDVSKEQHNDDMESNSFVSMAATFNVAEDDSDGKRKRSGFDDDQIVSSKRKKVCEGDESIPTDVCSVRSPSSEGLIINPVHEIQSAEAMVVPIDYPPTNQDGVEDVDDDAWLVAALDFQEQEESHHQNSNGSNMVEKVRGDDCVGAALLQERPEESRLHDGRDSCSSSWDDLVLPSLDELGAMLKFMDGLDENTGQELADQTWNQNISVDDYLFPRNQIGLQEDLMMISPASN